MPNYKIQRIYRLLPQPPKNLISHVYEQLFLKNKLSGEQIKQLRIM